MRIIFVSVFVLFLARLNSAFSQKVRFNRVVQNKTGSFNAIMGIAQDKQGYLWIATSNKGLQRYNGSELKVYENDPLNNNSLANNFTASVSVDSNNIVWIGTLGGGLDRYDPSINAFTHFRHDPNDGSSLTNDTVYYVLTDHSDNIWAGTATGLDMLDKKTGKFIHYIKKGDNALNTKTNFINTIYEDHQGVLWVGSIISFINGAPDKGFLSRLDKTTGKVTYFMHDSTKANSINGKFVRSILEDSKGNFWVGTGGDGLHLMDRDKGIFTHYYYDSLHPEKLSPPPLCRDCIFDAISFISEDALGTIWIGSVFNGINQYDPVTKKITHYGPIRKNNATTLFPDSVSTGFKDYMTSIAFSSKDGLFWIGTFDGSLYYTNLFKTTIPFYPTSDGNTFYYEQTGNILWIGTSNGLIRKNLDNQDQKTWKYDPRNINSLCNDTIGAMRVDDYGKFWLATNNGISKFDPRQNSFTTFRHNEKVPGSLSSDLLNNLYIDHSKNIWIGTVNTGVDKMDGKTGVFTNYRYDKKDTSSLSNDYVFCIAEDQNYKIWIGTNRGLNLLNNGNGKFSRYLKNSSIKSIFIDHAGIVWVGAYDGLYRLDHSGNQFSLYVDPNSRNSIKEVLHIMEDDHKNIWVSTNNAFIKINARRDEARIYGESYGVHSSTFGFADNFKGKNGQLFFGDQTGYYAFFPELLKDKSIPPMVSFTSFKLGDEEVKPTPGGVFSVPLWQAQEIRLKYNQNIFSFDFEAISYTHSDEKKYLFMLENYDNTWHYIGTDHKAYFFNIPPGTYIFHAKAVNADGVWDEKTIKIIIRPPWWRTWWAYTIFGLLFIGTVWGFIYYRSRKLKKENLLLEEKVMRRTTELRKSLQDLRETQTQLVQREKMASLGELTAGIAHEIQNPLNFVNNFSEVNKELIAEMREEIKKGNYDEVNALAKGVEDNQEKINHHGKRADAIVKGMLQHSRTSSGQNEWTPINILAEEYLRLAYHGLRAKDKSFNVTLKTDYDESIGSINIIPQDIGRVILNLINNAFYTTNEKQKQNIVGYEPAVTISTRKVDDKIELRVKDNGNGIPQKILDKIFQPFFTTKPTGQGTGLGLSLSYDIIKAHGGEIKMETKEGEGSTFCICLNTSA